MFLLNIPESIKNTNYVSQDQQFESNHSLFADFLDLLSRGRMFVHMTGRMRFAFVV